MFSLTNTASARGSVHSRCWAAPHRICTAVRPSTAQRVSYSLGDRSTGHNKQYAEETERTSPEHRTEQKKAPWQLSEALNSLPGHLFVVAVPSELLGDGSCFERCVDPEVLKWVRMGTTGLSFGPVPSLVSRPTAPGAVPGGRTSIVFAGNTDSSTNDGAVLWTDFWQQLEKAASGSKLDYTGFVYKAHDLHLPAQRLKFQQAVTSGSSTSNSIVLSRDDYDSLLSQTSSRHLAELVDLAMNMAWTEWYGGDGDGCTVSLPVQAPAGSWITAWSAGTKPTREAGSSGSNIIMLQGKMTHPGVGKWLDAVYADPEQSTRGTVYTTPDNSEGFTQAHGSYAEGQGLTSFMGLPTAGADACTGTPWTSTEPARLPLDCPARIVGYQARVKHAAGGQKVIDSVRFLVRSFAKTDTLYPAAFISYTGQDPEANLFATQLASALEEKGIPSFFAEFDLAAGVQWAPAIRDLASHCKVFVPVLSPQYLDRPWCLTELHLAINNRAVGAASVPILVSGPELTKHDFVQLTKEPLGPKQQGWLDNWAGKASEIAKNAGVTTLAPADIAADFVELLKHGLDEQSPEDVKDVVEMVARRVR